MAIVHLPPWPGKRASAPVRPPARRASSSPPAGVGLWVTDGGAAGTHLLRGFGSVRQERVWLTALGGAVLFVADTVTSGLELWRELFCAGDCDADGAVRIDELARGVRSALGRDAVTTCAVFDRNGDGAVRVDELVAAVVSALPGCA